MPDPVRLSTAAPQAAPENAAVRRIPLALRMLVYGCSFLAVVLVALPWAFYQIDVYFPAVHVEIGRPLRAVGLIWFVVFLTMYLASSWLLIRRGKGAYVEFDPPTELVIAGPYRWTRNPVAGTLVASFLGEAVALSSTGVFLMFCFAAGIAHVQVLTIEEPLLRRRFGRAYEDYCARVPRWIPRFGAR